VAHLRLVTDVVRTAAGGGGVSRSASYWGVNVVRENFLPRQSDSRAIRGVNQPAKRWKWNAREVGKRRWDTEESLRKSADC